MHEEHNTSMVPIFEQSNGRGVGHSFDTFHNRFEEICKGHAELGRAVSFAFIFYDLSDGSLKSILKDGGVFTKLDRLAGERLSVFYLHNPDHRTAKHFNQEFPRRLGISISGPCVVFFRFDSDGICDIQVCAIESTHVMQGFQAIHAIVSEYLANAVVKTPYHGWRSFGSGLRWVGKEVIGELVKEAIENGRVLEHVANFFRLH